MNVLSPNLKKKIIQFISRMLHWTSALCKGFISLVGITFFINHFAYLSIGRFDYQYNMKANILTGTYIIAYQAHKANEIVSIYRFFEPFFASSSGIATGIGWIIWYALQRKKHPYAWKILLFQFLVAISLMLEVNDFPPLLWVFDAHSLWHLSTVLPTLLLYRHSI